MKRARLKVLEALRSHAAALIPLAGPQESEEAALLERELARRIETIRFSLTHKKTGAAVSAVDAKAKEEKK